jgi:hypothetical protein
MAGSTCQGLVHPNYSQGYSADVDVIRDQEYPLLNGTNAQLLHSIHTDHYYIRNNILGLCGDNTLCQVHDRVFLA